MKLDEILNIGQHKNKRFSLSVFNLDDKIWHGKGECDTHCEIFELHPKNKSDNYILFGLFKMPEFELRTSIIGIYERGYFVIKDAYTPDEFKQKGFASSLYRLLVKHCGIKLMSDSEQSPYGRKLWNSLRKNKMGIKIYNTNTGEIILDDGTIPEDELYTNWDDAYSNRYRLVYESTDVQSNKLLTPYIYCTDKSKHGQFE